MSESQSPSQSVSSIQGWLFLFLIGITWGSSYFFMKHGLEAFSPVQLFSLRISLASLAFMPMAFRAFRQVKRSEYKYLLIVGFCGSFIPAFLFALAQTHLSSSVTGVLSSLSPLWTLIVGGTIYGLVLNRNHIAGVLIGLAGAISLVLATDGSFSGNFGYAGCVIGATFLYAFSTNTVNSYLGHLSSMQISSIAFTFIGIPALVILFSSDFTGIMQTHPKAWSAFGYICALSLLGTVMASLVYFKLIQMTGAVFASTVSYIIPLVALVLGGLDGENLGLYHVLGMACVLAGVYISKQPVRPKKKA